MYSYKKAGWALLLLVGLQLSAQQVQISIIPGTEYTMARRDEWKVVVNNTTSQTLRVFFYGLGTEVQRGKVYEVLSQQRDLPPGITTFSTQYYVGLQPFNTLYEDQSLREYAIRTNALPAGDYEFCIKALSAVDSTELGENCYQFTADYFTPPVLILPENNDTVREDYPYFSWLPPVPNNGQAFTYTLTLYELQNMQTAFSATQTNAPFYERKAISMPAAQYGINARNLRQGYRYAWKVSAEVNGNTVATSEVWSFVFAKDKLTTTADTAKKKPEVKNPPLPGIPYMELKNRTGADYSVVTDGKMSFVFINQLKQDKLGYQVLNAQQQQVDKQVLECGYGYNYYSIDMKAGGKLQSGNYYVLQTIDANGNILKARFKFIQ